MKTNIEIRSEVMNELKNSLLLASTNIAVDVICGKVFLSGKVDCYRKKFEAAQRTRSMQDIKAVRNDLYVDLLADNKRTDAEIKNAITYILQENSIIPGKKISFSVYDDGIVVLTGDAENNVQKYTIMNAVIDVPGIVNVWDFIKVKKFVINDKEKNIVGRNKYQVIETSEIPAEDLVMV